MVSSEFQRDKPPTSKVVFSDLLIKLFRKWFPMYFHIIKQLQTWLPMFFNSKSTSKTVFNKDQKYKATSNMFSMISKFGFKEFEYNHFANSFQ